MITAIALDDEPPALKILENFAAKSDKIKLERTFTRPNEAMAYLKKFPVDLIFLDIQMPSISGIDFYAAIKQDTFVIFTTAYPEFAVEGFNLSAIDYLLKPFTPDRFNLAVEKAVEFIHFKKGDASQDPTSLFLRVDYGLKKIDFSSIQYMEALSDYIKIYLDTEEVVVVRMPLKVMLEKLPASTFLRVHRSFIVHSKFITAIRNKTIFINDIQIPVGRSYEQEVKEFLDF